MCLIKANPRSFLLMHAMGPYVAGVIDFRHHGWFLAGLQRFRFSMKRRTR